MFYIAVVEDQKDNADTLCSYIKKYGLEKHIIFEIDVFTDGLNFISDYTEKYDMVFMDIAMPHMDGLEAAHKLREMDNKVGLIFITTLAKYAIRGYEVQAMDFLIKPIKYELFHLKFEKALSMRKYDIVFRIPLANGGKKLLVSDITYIESCKHYIYFHTELKEYRMRGSMKEISEFFLKNSFALASGSLLVNLAYVEEFQGGEVIVNGEKFVLARKYKTDFINELTEYMGGI